MPIRVDHIMSAVVVLIVVAIGIFVFFVVVNSLPPQQKQISDDNDISSPNQIFSIIGIVAIVGVALSILTYVSRLITTSGTEDSFDDSVSTPELIQTKEKTNEEIEKEIEKEFEKEKRQDQLQIVHEKYFKGRTSRVGRAIKYVEEENKVGDNSNDSIIT